MTFNIAFDYRFDTGDFFTGARKTALEEAASIWEDLIGDEFPDVPAGLDLSVRHPETGNDTNVALSDPIDDLRMFVGASDPPFQGSDGPLAQAGFTSAGLGGDRFQTRVGDSFRTGPVTDFEPYVGSFSVDPSYAWHFDTASGPDANEFDFLSVALHEIGHALGLGTAPVFRDRASGGFDGPNATDVNGGSAIPVTGDNAHVQDGFDGDTVLMDPTLTQGDRKLPTDVDKALLADIGYDIDGFTNPGSTPPIVTPNDDVPVFGSNVADTLDGLAGDDQLQGRGGADVLRGSDGQDLLFGESGDDTLSGGAGDDVLDGGAGDDRLVLGAGSDTVQLQSGSDTVVIGPGDGANTVSGSGSGGVQGFETGTDVLRLEPGLGFSDPADVLASHSKPYANVTRFELDATTSIDIFHASQSGTPLTEDDIVIGSGGTSNTPPDPSRDSGTVDAGTSIAIDVLANDSDPDGDTLSIASVGTPSNGSVTASGGVVTYTADADGAGTDSFSYTVADGSGGTATGLVEITVADSNTPPTAADDTATTLQGQTTTLDVLANDSDNDGDPLSLQSVDASSANGTATMNGDDTVDFTPNGSFTGETSFTYMVSDGSGGMDQGTVTVSVSASNRPPAPDPDSATTTAGTAISLDVLANDSDPDGDSIGIVSVGDPANGSASVSGGQIAYDPDPGFDGIDRFDYTIKDTPGDTATAEIAVTVEPANAPPALQPDSATVTAGNTVEIDVLANDGDPDGDTLRLDSLSGVSGGSGSITAGDTVRFAADAGTSGTTSFTYTVSDGSGGTDSGSVSVTVTPGNAPPLAADDSVTTTSGNPVGIDVLANDSDPDNDALAIQSVGSPPNGSVSVNADDTLTFAPDPSFTGTASFSYTVSDGSGGTATGTVTVDVTPGNRPPSARADSVTTRQGESVTADVLANDGDPDGDSLAVVAVGPVSGGSAAVTDTGAIEFLPEPGFGGTARVPYTIADPDGARDSAHLDVNLDARPTVAFDAPAQHPGNGSTATFDVTFSEPVQNVDASDFVADGSAFRGTTGQVTVGDAGDADASTYAVSVARVSGDGTLGLDLLLPDIVDDAQQDLVMPPTRDETVTVGAGAPDAPDAPTRFDVLTGGNDPLTVTPGTFAQVIDAAGAQTVNVTRGASLALEATTGANTVNVDGASGEFAISRDVATVTLDGPNNQTIRLAARDTPQQLVFRDGALDLEIDGGDVVAGDQTVTGAAADLDTALVGGTTSTDIFDG